MDRERIKGLVNLAQKAGAVIRGSDNLDGYDKKLYLVLIDETAGKSSQKIAMRLKDRAKIMTVENLAQLVGRDCKMIGIKNKGLSEEIAKLIEE